MRSGNRCVCISNVGGAHLENSPQRYGNEPSEDAKESRPGSPAYPVAGMPLAALGCQGTNVTDLMQNKDLPLKYLWFDFQSVRDTARLHAMPTLEFINDKPVAEFWNSP